MTGERVFFVHTTMRPKVRTGSGTEDLEEVGAKS